MGVPAAFGPFHVALAPSLLQPVAAALLFLHVAAALTLLPAAVLISSCLLLTTLGVLEEEEEVVAYGDVEDAPYQEGVVPFPLQMAFPFQVEEVDACHAFPYEVEALACQASFLTLAAFFCRHLLS